MVVAHCKCKQAACTRSNNTSLCSELIMQHVYFFSVTESIEEFADAVLVAMNGTENVTLARENFAVLAVEPQPDSSGQIESFVVQVEVGEPLSNASDFNNAVFSSSLLPSGDPLAYVVMNENLIQVIQNTSSEPDQDPRLIFVVYEINSPLFQDPDGNETGSVIFSVLRSPEQGPPPTNLDEPVMFQFQVDPGRVSVPCCMCDAFTCCLIIVSSKC